MLAAGSSRVRSVPAPPLATRALAGLAGASRGRPGDQPTDYGNGLCALEIDERTGRRSMCGVVAAADDRIGSPSFEPHSLLPGVRIF